ncbi:hypothetical protein SADUNF_Sadunf08G0138900 [Salix dunnii]|uniref:CRIB domain-containing protein n=1 Tax=Salix dunnii TaxID=1413687 RepID=A0A835K0T4_9ROSI|nr:hypothetical protein SADUNF_Sadunf08G0138900 [Salix dunnii]
MEAAGQGTVFTPSLEGMKHVKSDNGEMLTKPFLDVCKLILPVIDKFGAAMTLVKSDIGTRLENKYLSDPSKYIHLYTMVQEEVDAKTAKGSSSCTNCLLWLTRKRKWIAVTMQGYLRPDTAEVVMKLVPDRKKFMEVISGSGNVAADMEQFCTTFPPFLEENHKFLVRCCALRKAVLPTLKHRCSKKEEQQQKPKVRIIFPNRFSRAFMKRQFIEFLLPLIGDKANNQEFASIRVEGWHLVHGTKLCDLGQRLFDVQSLTLQDHGIVLTSLFCFSKVVLILYGDPWRVNEFSLHQFNNRISFAGATKLIARVGHNDNQSERSFERFFTNFADEKEEEMQIGFPTDVKHVAHIGCDGPSATNAPSWMNEFNSPPEHPCATSNSKEEVKSLSTDPHSEDTIQTEKPKHRSRRSSGSASSLLNSPDRRSADSSRNSRHQASSSTGSPLNSPRGTDAPKSSRRHRSSNKSMDSPKGESSGTSRISRRQKNSSLDAESPTHDQSSIPKHSRGRKSKGSPGSGPSKSKEKKSSKEAAPFSDPGCGGCESINGRTNLASQLSSVLEAHEEEG